MKTFSDFISTYKWYRRFHSRWYATCTAWNVAVRGLPF